MIHFEAVADADEPRTAQQEAGARPVRLPLKCLALDEGWKAGGVSNKKLDLAVLTWDMSAIICHMHKRC